MERQTRNMIGRGKEEMSTQLRITKHWMGNQHNKKTLNSTNRRTAKEIALLITQIKTLISPKMCEYTTSIRKRIRLQEIKNIILDIKNSWIGHWKQLKNWEILPVQKSKGQTDRKHEKLIDKKNRQWRNKTISIHRSWTMHQKLLELIDKLSKVIGHNINAQKSVTVAMKIWKEN